MRIFETTSVYDFDNQEWKEVYKLNGEVVDEETYFDAMETETSGEELDEDEECDCENCEENDDMDDTTEEECRIIGEAIDKIFEVFPCPNCVAETVMDLAYRFREIGWKDHQDRIREFNEDED